MQTFSSPQHPGSITSVDNGTACAECDPDDLPSSPRRRPRTSGESGSSDGGKSFMQPRKQFINLMEELVLKEAIAQIEEFEATSDCLLDIGDIAAYALNRLPPLYATTDEGADYQRQRAEEELQETIAQRVSEAIVRHLEQPETLLKGQPLGKSSPKELFKQISTLLEANLHRFEQDDRDSV
ncbi:MULTISPECIES: late competence development ComFB family protein [Aerosakkonema]|uniref:late competence development ComFB family protein n=1 Tax=Aerosakkonema TaxID=1246629 RepID=UPI0035B72C6C